MTTHPPGLDHLDITAGDRGHLLLRAQHPRDRGHQPAQGVTVDLVRALFPCGSITGAPKIRAMELIDAVERDPRGPYCGAIGRIGPGGEAAFNVAIRTIRLTPGENDKHHAVLGVPFVIITVSATLQGFNQNLVRAAASPARQRSKASPPS